MRDYKRHRHNEGSRQIRLRLIGPLADVGTIWAPHFLGPYFPFFFGKLGLGKLGPLLFWRQFWPQQLLGAQFLDFIMRQKLVIFPIVGRLLVCIQSRQDVPLKKKKGEKSICSLEKGRSEKNWLHHYLRCSACAMRSKRKKVSLP